MIEAGWSKCLNPLNQVYVFNPTLHTRRASSQALLRLNPLNQVYVFNTQEVFMEKTTTTLVLIP